jgi:hypothetical protein
MGSATHLHLSWSEHGQIYPLVSVSSSPPIMRPLFILLCMTGTNYMTVYGADKMGQKGLCTRQCHYTKYGRKILNFWINVCSITIYCNKHEGFQ